MDWLWHWRKTFVLTSTDKFSLDRKGTVGQGEQHCSDIKSIRWEARYIWLHLNLELSPKRKKGEAVSKLFFSKLSTKSGKFSWKITIWFPFQETVKKNRSKLEKYQGNNFVSDGHFYDSFWLAEQKRVNMWLNAYQFWHILGLKFGR